MGGLSRARNAKSEQRLISIEEVWFNKLSAAHRPSESKSDVVVRQVELEARGAKIPYELTGP